MMVKLSDELKEAISQIKPAMVATTSKEGKPNVSPKGSLQVLDEQHLLFVDLRSPQTIKNLKENPCLSVIVFEQTSRKGWRIWGKVEEIIASGDLYDKFVEKYASKGRVNHVIIILVEKSAVF